MIHKKVQNRGTQMKPRIIQLLEEQRWKEVNPDTRKYIGYEDDGDVCFYFPDCKTFPEATTDPHYLLKVPQLCRSQATACKADKSYY